MGEGLGLGLCARGSGEGCLGFCGGSDMGEEVDFVGDGTAEIVERFADVGRIVVGFVCIL